MGDVLDALFAPILLTLGTALLCLLPIGVAGYVRYQVQKAGGAFV